MAVGEVDGFRYGTGLKFPFDQRPTYTLMITSSSQTNENPDVLSLARF